MPYETLFSPANIGNVTIKNRVVMAPMVMGTGAPDGTPTEQMKCYYEERAKGGVGLIITEATRVDDATGVLAPRQLAMSRDKHIEPFAQMVKRVHKHGTKIFCQLHHPGRQNYSILVGTSNISQAIGSVWRGYWKLFFQLAQMNAMLEKTGLLLPVVGPSAVPCRHQKQKTRALKLKEIKKIIQEFGDAAYRVKQAGADGVELHGAHGYLIQQFLSPYTNRRTDEYGGSFENRMRFLEEIIGDIRQKCGKDFPLVVRLTVEEFYDKIDKEDHGLHLPEGVRIAKWLEQLGVDALDISSASYETMNYWLEPVTFAPGWRAYLAKAVKDAVDIPVLAANLVRSPEQAEQQLRDGVQDFISLARPLLADSAWANKAQAGRPQDIKRCIQCLWCFESMLDKAWCGKAGECAVNPRTCSEVKYPEKPNAVGEGRVVAVVGAGPAGLMAAETLAKRGFRPVVLEKEAQAGGQVTLAAQPPDKEKLFWCIADLKHTVEALGVEIRYNTAATPELLQEMNPYAIFIATGGKSLMPKIPGVEAAHVHTVEQVLCNEVDLRDKRVAVIGSGLTGLETAEFLCAKGNEVTVVEMAPTLAPGAYHQHVEDILPRLQQYGVAFQTGQKLVEIGQQSITLKNCQTQEQTKAEADAVVLAVGVCACNELYQWAKQRYRHTYAVGDAKSIGKIANATRAAYHAAMALEE